MSYIDPSDFTDEIVQGFDLQKYIDKADKEINDLAQRLGVSQDDIDDDPLHYKIKEYAIAFVIAYFCKDKMGTNDTEVPELEKYVVKYKVYKDEAAELLPQITFEMYTGNVDEIRDRAIVSGTLYHG